MYRIDGYDADNDEVLEYHGCFWHVCPVCLPDDRIKTKNPSIRQSMSELNVSAEKKISYLWACGLTVTGMWVHKLSDKWKNDPNLRHFVASLI